MKKRVIIHPLLFAIYPTLAFFSHNIALIDASQIIRPLLTAVIASLILFFSLGGILKNNKKAGLIVSLFILWFFSYGYFCRFFYILAEYFQFDLTKSMVSPIAMAFSGSIFILLIDIFFIIKTRKELINPTKILNVVSAFLILFSVINIGISEISAGVFWPKGIILENIQPKGAGISSYPNIYYIVLDGYAREDVLRQLYEYDNKEFIEYLTNKGFYVADKSVSNYCQTVLSFASSLNFEYLDNLVAKVGSSNPNRKWATAMMRNSRVFRFLKECGYTTVTFDAAGSWDAVIIKNVDKFYSSYKKAGANNFRDLELNFFERELLSSTPIALALDKLRKKKIEDNLLGDAYDFHRKKVLYTFDKIEDLSKDKGPIFVFAHFLSPHQPFVFGENGQAVATDSADFTIWCWNKVFRKNFKSNYKRQLKFVNKRVQKMIDKIIANSSQPPIIILQADHGSELMLDPEDPSRTNLNERMPILNAYYFPGHKIEELYPSITPVNTFRLIFNYYFKTHYDLLKDKSYFSTWSKPYKFIDVTDKVIEEK